MRHYRDQCLDLLCKVMSPKCTLRIWNFLMNTGCYFSEKNPRHMEIVRILNTKLLLQTRYNEYSIFNSLNITHQQMLS